MKNRPAKLRLTVLTGSMLMLLAGYDFYTGGLIAAAAVYVFAAVTGVSMLRNARLSDGRVLLYSGMTQAGLSLINAVVLFQAGKRGLPYAWLAAAAVAAQVAWKNRNAAQAGSGGEAGT